LRHTTYTEGYVLLCAAYDALRERAIRVSGAACGCYFDAFDKSGAIISMLKLDDELKKYIAPAKGYDFTL